MLALQAIRNATCCTLAITLDRVAELAGVGGVFYRWDEAPHSYVDRLPCGGIVGARLGRWEFIKDGKPLHLGAWL